MLPFFSTKLSSPPSKSGMDRFSVFYVSIEGQHFQNIRISLAKVARDYRHLPDRASNPLGMRRQAKLLGDRPAK